MKPCNSKTHRFNQQHKIYEQGRRSRITQLISSLHDCLPREYKANKDKQTDILSAVLSYVQFLQERAESTNATMIQESIRREQETLKAYVVSLEERCDRYAKLLDSNGSEKVHPHTAKPGNNAAGVPGTVDPAVPFMGPVSVVAASAPLVFLVSHPQMEKPVKTCVDASSSTASENWTGFPGDSYAENCTPRCNVVWKDASVGTDQPATVDCGTDTAIVGLHLFTSTVAVQVGSTDFSDRGCSPVTFASPESTDGDALTGDNVSKPKRKRVDEPTGTISEIVDLVAANRSMEQSGATGAESSSGQAAAGGASQATALLSVSTLLERQNGQHRRVDCGQGPTKTSEASNGNAVASAMVTITASTHPTATWSSLHPAGRPMEANVSQDQQHQQMQKHQQPLISEGDRNPFPLLSPYQPIANATNSVNRTSLTANSSNGRMNEESGKRNSSRRGANFSVEFLHGGATNGPSESVQRRTGDRCVQTGQQAHSIAVGPSSTFPYAVDSQEQTTNTSLSCEYYDPQISYGTTGSHWPARDPFWPSEGSYLWTNQPSSAGFVSMSSNCNPRRNGGVNVTGGKSSSSGDPKSGANLGSASSRASDGSVNLSNPFGAGSGLCSVPPTTLGYALPGAQPDCASTSSRKGYCGPPPFFADPSNFGYTRNYGLTNSSSAIVTTSNNATFSSPSVQQYSYQYWPSSEWTPSSFLTGDDPIAGFHVGDQSANQQQNNGKAQNFQIATMFPEASLSSTVISGGTDWRNADAYKRQQLGQQTGLAVQRNHRMTGNSYRLEGASSYGQTGDNGCGSGVARFSQ